MAEFLQLIQNRGLAVVTGAIFLSGEMAGSGVLALPNALLGTLCSKNAKVLMEGCQSKIHMPCERGPYTDIKKQSIFQKCLGKFLTIFREQFDQGSPVPFHLA